MALVLQLLSGGDVDLSLKFVRFGDMASEPPCLIAVVFCTVLGVSDRSSKLPGVRRALNDNENAA